MHYDWERDPARQAAVRRNLLSTAEDAIEFPFQGACVSGQGWSAAVCCCQCVVAPHSRRRSGRLRCSLSLGLAYLGALHPQQHVAVKPAHSSRCVWAW